VRLAIGWQQPGRHPFIDTSVVLRYHEEVSIGGNSQRFQRHLFVCTNQRDPSDPRGCCGAKGSESLRRLFKDEIKKAGLKGRVRANAAGCLDYCAMGPTVVVYPEGTWYFVDTPDDVNEIVQQHIMKGKIVERLRMPRRQPNTDASTPSAQAT
jgi:(2Fe-2S) ferredoxin